MARTELLRINKAFTLIELMVVISVISLLASTVLASLQYARIKAHNVKYATELRQLQTALLIYRSNNLDQVPACPYTLAQGGCHDVAGSTRLDEALAPLVAQNYISKIPHSHLWPSHANKTDPPPIYAARYLPNTIDSFNYPVEYACRDIEFSDWVVGTLPGVIIVATTETLPLPLGMTQCTDFDNTCTYATQSNLIAGLTLNQYCLPIGVDDSM